jgi:hypothetical protein
MDEESRFWIIPIMCFIAIVPIMVFAVDYKVNTVAPNVEIEREEMENMTCPEMLVKASSNHYWSTGNKEIGEAKILGCTETTKSQSLGLDPYVEFCNPGGYAPDKKIENNTHSFNHVTCIWDMK